MPTRPCIITSFGVVRTCLFVNFFFVLPYFPDILPCRSAANARIAARRKTVGDVHAVTSPMPGLPGPEGLRKTEGKRYRDTVHTAERQEVHGGEGLAVVATVG